MMKKNHITTITAALLMVAALLSVTACSNDDMAIDNPTPVAASGETIQFTATLAPKGDDGTTTRAITTGKDAENKEILNVAWAEGEQIAIYYQKTDNSYATATATIGVPNANGSTPINASLPDAKGGTAKFVFPASLQPFVEIRVKNQI